MLRAWQCPEEEPPVAEDRHVCIAKISSRDTAASTAPQPITVGPAPVLGSWEGWSQEV